LVRYGAQQRLEREYGQYVVAPEQGYNFSILIDLENLPADQGLYIWKYTGGWSNALMMA
jgi:hypothetical protein